MKFFRSRTLMILVVSVTGLAMLATLAAQLLVAP